MSTSEDRVVAEFEKKLFDSALGTGRAYRKLNCLVNFDEIAARLQETYSNLGQPGIPAVRGFKALLLQFWEDYSDREMEAAVRENLANIFNTTNEQLRKEGLFGNIFFFIDASTIISKSALWKERDKAIKDGHDKLNNLIVKDYVADKEALWGAKSKKNIWFGYKRHTAVDMRYGLITKTTITPANVLDYQVVEQICPEQGYIFMDKLYDTKKTDQKIRASGCSPGTIRKNNNPNKDPDLDRWRTRMRMPYESTFSKLPKRARYKGKMKVAYQNFGESISFNFKKAIHYLPKSTYN